MDLKLTSGRRRYLPQSIKKIVVKYITWDEKKLSLKEEVGFKKKFFLLFRWLLLN